MSWFFYWERIIKNIIINIEKLKFYARKNKY